MWQNYAKLLVLSMCARQSSNEPTLWQVSEFGPIQIDFKVLTDLDGVDLSEVSAATHQRRGPLKNPSNDQRRFQQLSSMVQPGLSEIEFRNLFTKCGVCGLIKMREIFVFHLCPAEVTDSDDTDRD